jgi:hypothetical protein
VIQRFAVRGSRFTVHGLPSFSYSSSSSSSIWVIGVRESVRQASAVRPDTDRTYRTHRTYGSRRFAGTTYHALNVPIDDEDEYDDAERRTVNPELI